jgi:IclR family acetate operon transcriptional repressor
LGKAILAHLDSDDLVNYLAKTELVAYTSDTINSKESLLIEIEKIRQQGYAVSRRELLLDTVCLAAPIFGCLGQVTAAISLTTTPDRLLEKEEAHYATKVIETAWIISREMGYFPEKMAFSVR